LNLFDLKTVILAKHAQHVVLIHFPIALFTTSVAFDFRARWTRRPGFGDAAYYNLFLAAISTGTRTKTSPSPKRLRQPMTLLHPRNKSGALMPAEILQKIQLEYVGRNSCSVLLVGLGTANSGSHTLCSVQSRGDRKRRTGLATCSAFAGISNRSPSLQN